MPTPVHDLDLPSLDLTGVDDHRTALDLIERTQERSWIARTPLGYSILRYEDVVAVLRDKRFHQLARQLARLAGLDRDERFMARQRTSILTAEGDEHTRLRRLVAPAFSPRSADRLRPFMRQVVESLVDPVAPAGSCELVADVCEPYPIPIICELLGAPKEDWRLFSRWATDMLRILSVDLVADLPLIDRAREEMDAYVTELIEVRRSEPHDDLLTDLIAAEEAGDRLSHEELVIMVEAVLIGGTDTTRNQLACAMAVFAEHPDQWRLVAEHPELAPRAVEEAMRYLGAVRGTGRYASEDIVYRDVLFPEGTLVFPSLVGANHDGGAWSRPDTFDITREPAPQPQPQLTFGSGIHYCLGAALARAELQEALPILARRMPGLTLEGPVVWKPLGTAIWGPERLPLRFEPGH